jgi:hypothetical protein
MQKEKEKVATVLSFDDFVRLQKLSLQKGWSLGAALRFLVEFGLSNEQGFEDWFKARTEEKVRELAIQ